MQQLSERPHSTAVLAADDDLDFVPDTPFEEGAHDTLDPDLRHRMISEAAYYLYTQRGYGDGYDLDDWLQAEAQVDHMITNAPRTQTGEKEASES